MRREAEVNRDFRDHVIEELADKLAAAEARADIYRTIALEAVALLAERGRELEMVDRRRLVFKRHEREAHDRLRNAEEWAA